MRYTYFIFLRCMHICSLYVYIFIDFIQQLHVYINSRKLIDTFGSQRFSKKE